MKASITDYARLGIVHHMLYPECTNDPDDHVKTLQGVARRTDIETFDCCVPYGDDRRSRLIPVIKGSGKEVVYAIHLFPLMKISLASLVPSEQAITRLVLEDQINIAAAIGAKAMIFASGADAPPGKRPQAQAAFAEFCVWFCRELDKRGMDALLEPFDRTVDKKFLYGPTQECVDLIRDLAPRVGNLGIELDMAHLPLMYEPFGQAITTAALYLKRVHLGNCVLRDPASPYYGDQHPAMGLSGGEVDVPQLVEILSTLLSIGYLNRKQRGALILEMRPLPGRTAEETLADNLDRVRRAWQQVAGPLDSRG